MNFQPSLLRNHFFPTMKPFLPSPNPSQQNPTLLAKFFCYALQESLKRFTAFELQKLPHRENSQGKKKPQKIEPQVIELLSSDEQVEKEDSKMNDKNKENKGKDKMQVVECEQKTDLSKDHAQYEKQSNRNSEKEEGNSPKKTYLIRKQKNQKGSLKLKKHKYLRVKQNLDLTQTVDVRSLPFSAQQLNRKRQALFLRTVFNWNEAGLEKKERRQIRMLKN